MNGGERREPPLLSHLRLLIEAEGPIGIDRYMQLCLGHPRYGYYMTRDPFGAAGDFVTAPEVSQMFGELIGLWCVDSWQRLGAPAAFHLVELGPGRGTLMADALRAARLAPAFGAALRLHMVETSPVLRQRQRATLATSGTEATWHDHLAAVPNDAPLLVIANEFFDALPVRQWQKADAGWHERLVGIGPDGRLAFGLAPHPAAGAGALGPAERAALGDVLEVAEVAAGIMRSLAGRLVRQGGAALVIDYGHAGRGVGDTLQAVRGHAFVDVLAEPGETDLTVHVDFEALAAQALAGGAQVFPLLAQGDFLSALGIETRAATLSRAGARGVDAALSRLVGRDEAGMGALFKVLAVSSPSCPALAAFGEPLRQASPLRQPTSESTAMIQAPDLIVPGLVHGFFTREGGVSTGLYASLNGGLGSADERSDVLENRRRMAERLGVPPQNLVNVHQVHSALAVPVTGPWPGDDRPRADGMVTATPGVALAIATADCGPVLFADVQARIIGACHSGWRGAFDGILEATLAGMEALGAERSRVLAVLGPTIGRTAYEVGPEFTARFYERDPSYQRFFSDETADGHARFDLPAFIGWRLAQAGVGRFVDLGLCTYSDEQRFFSFRRTTHRGEPDYGRLIAAIALTA